MNRSFEAILQQYDLTQEKLEVPISDIHCIEFSEKLTEWEPLAPRLGLTRAEISEINKDNPLNFRKQCSACLLKWKEKYGRNATYWMLAQCLYAITALDYIDTLFQMNIPTPVPPSDTEVAAVTTTPRKQVVAGELNVLEYSIASVHVFAFM